VLYRHTEWIELDRATHCLGRQDLAHQELRYGRRALHHRSTEEICATSRVEIAPEATGTPVPTTPVTPALLSEKALTPRSRRDGSAFASARMTIDYA